MRIANISFLVLVFHCSLLAQNPAVDTSQAKEKVKSGWNFGAVPAIAFDSDIGFKYGAIVNFFDYGDGTIYPDYKHSLYFEWSLTTKGSGINQILFDSRALIPGTQVTAEASYLTERALDFYGYNGYKALYKQQFEDDDNLGGDYKSRVYYRQDRKMIRLRTDFTHKIKDSRFKWIAGIAYYDIKLDTVDTKRLNKGKSGNDKLPYIGGGLFGQYIEWDVFPDESFSGGTTTLLKLGFSFDSRNNEPNPTKGIWTEALLIHAPSFLSSSKGFSKLSLTHRQYFTLFPRKLSLAYRLGYQALINGNTPSYMVPFVFYSGRAITRDGLGGSKNLRGILRNRVVGEDILYANFELRWITHRFVLLNQNFYTALSAFTDMGMVTREYPINLDNVDDRDMYLFPDTKEKLHQSFGVGLHVAMNENFIVAFDYGRALDADDGKQGLYITLNWLF